MSETNENCVTDSNVVQEQVSVVNDDVPTSGTSDQSQAEQREKVNYEVVFFARYHSCTRPPADDVTAYFNKYGTVHHVNCPKDTNYAFVFMASLNTTAEKRRTRTTISQIIQDMTPENKFHITVASSNRGAYSQSYQPRQYNNNGYQNNSENRNYGQRQYNRSNDDRYGGDRYNEDRSNGGRYQNEGYGRRPYMRNAGPNDTYDSNRPVRRAYQSNGSSYRPKGTYQMHDQNTQYPRRSGYKTDDGSSQWNRNAQDSGEKRRPRDAETKPGVQPERSTRN